MIMTRLRLAIIVLAGIGVSGMALDRAAAQPAPAPPPASAPAAQPGAVATTPAPAVPGAPAAAAASAPQPGAAGVGTEPVVQVGRGGYVYLPEGRRDPFLSILRDAGAGGAGQGQKTDEINVPPLQRVAVAELTVIGIVWGGFGYMAMLQTPDGKGYPVQRGARIGNNNGVVSAITEKAVIVEERFTDIYGKKQVREYAKPLHVKESLP